MRASMTQNSFLDKELLNSEWENNPRWDGITRNYSAEDVVSIRNSIEIKYTLAENGANNLFNHLMKKDEWISALGALSGNQAVQMVKAGLKAIYLSGWQVAADSNLGETTYPDQSLYPSNSAPNLAKRINNALLRAEQVDRVEENFDIDYVVPIVADGEAGFGGVLNVFELTKKFIEAGAAGIHFEDQLAAEKNVDIWEEKFLYQLVNT
jgi:isocitrate lyase